MTSPCDRRDAWLWGVVSGLLLVLLPVGLLSPDGVGQAARAATGDWQLNPNHLLFEPANTFWVAVTGALLPDRLPADRLRLLSALCGALAAGLFRGGLAPRLTSSQGAGSRRAANYGTAWLALSAVFSQLWVSAETYMIQMPALVAAAILLLALRQERWEGSPRRALALGAALGLAALCFASSALLAPFAVLALVWPRRERESSGRRLAAFPIREIAALGAGFCAVLLPALGGAWFCAVRSSGRGFLDWLLSYGGSGGLGRLHQAYGVTLSARGLSASALRALYGAACSLVDLSPAVAAWRDGHRLAVPIATGLVALGALGALAAAAWKRPDEETKRDLVALGLFLVPATLLFGWLWNNSDLQFYAPLGIAWGALAAAGGLPSRKLATLGVLGLLGLAWNATDLACRFVLYPRAERLALLENTAKGACAVVYPGFDELEALIGLTWPPPAWREISITHLAITEPPERGLPKLRETVERCLRTGGRVVFLDLYGRPPFEPPWKFLRALGYEPEGVRRALAGLPFDGLARSVGPWTVRVARGP
ncbi:MAG TPA: hypothetical protein VN783_16735 [Thermoanaerobaculia bacterium]|nr:hypothetical protein [Thermoanaerobaculia bacterium]